MARKKREMTTEIQFATNRCIENRCFFTPSKEVNRILMAALIYAALQNRVKIFAFAFMPNYFQLLLQTPKMNLQAFMRDFQGAIARDLNRLHGRSGPVFVGRYHNAVVKSDALAYYYRYINNSVPRSNSSALSSARALRTGEKLVGRRVNRTKYGILRRKDPNTPIEGAIEEYELELAIPDEWADQDPEEVRARVMAMIDEDDARLQARRESEDVRSWRDEPKQTKCPVLCLTFSPEARRQHLEHHRRMTQAYIRAVRRMRAGKKRPGFPVGTFPPGWSRCVMPGDKWAAAPLPANDSVGGQLAA